MSRHVRLQELLVGIEGLALLRHLYDGTDEDASRRLAEVRQLLDDDSLAAGEDIPEADPRSGYALWAANYDEPGNPVVGLEGPAVQALVVDLPPGRALDAACGTGRHAQYLAAHGHAVTGFDLTPEMLELARKAVPDGVFFEANLLDVPLGDEQFDLVVCGLALSHVDDLGAAVAELARVLRPGGSLVASVMHPFLAIVGQQAPFSDENGQRHFVREYPYSHADYVTAFGEAGLQVRDCIEPSVTETELAAKRRAFRHIPAAVRAAYLATPAVLVWRGTKL